MSEIYDGQFEIDGVKFGLHCPMSVEAGGFSPGRAALIGDPVKMAGADGIRFGRRRYGSSTWSFQMFADRSDPEGALASYAELGQAWPREEVRLNSDTVSMLRYALAGRVRVVFGQGGRWSPVITNALLGGTMAVAADFETVDHLHYSDEVFSEEVPIALPLSTGGLIPPFIPPFTSTGSNGVRAGSISVGGDRPTPVWVVFTGPVSDPRIDVSGTLSDGKPWAGWTAQVTDTVYSGDPVTLDARPWARSATRQGGGSVRVSPRVTKISQMFLPPGQHTINFSGMDPTGSASVNVHWRNAYSHL